MNINDDELRSEMTSLNAGHFAVGRGVGEQAIITLEARSAGTGGPSHNYHWMI